MSTNRRLNLRKGKNNNNDGNQSISNFVQRRSKDPVEIEDDDDEVVQLTDQYAFSEEEVVRPLKRRKKKIVVEENNDDEEDNNFNELEGMEDMDEDEKEQMKEALRQSRLELENEEKRRKIYKMFESAKFNAAVGTEIPTTSEADIPSSPISSSIEPQCVERAESPDLFGPTPDQSSYGQDKRFDVTPSESGSSMCDARSYKKSPFKKEINIQISPIKRPLPMRNFSSKFEKEASPNHKEPPDNTPTSTCTVSSKGKFNKLSLDTKKRKHSIEDASDDDGNDVAKENIKDSAPVETRKRQKTIEDNFQVLKSKNPKIEKKEKLQPKHFVINDSDDEFQDGSESDNRNTSTRKHKKSFRVSLKRSYKKPRLPIKTVRDAMKARLYFAPPGIDHKLYTFAIIRMLDRTKECIRKAQQNSLQFVKWGLPVVAGPRDGDSLDAKMDKRKSHVAKKEPVSNNSPELKTRRSLRSTRSKANEPVIKTESNQTTTAEVKIEKDPTDSTQISTKNLGFVSSDDSDEELTKPVFGHNKNNPKSWKEYNAKTDSFKFGENINTSATCITKDDEKNNKLINDKDNKKDKERKERSDKHKTSKDNKRDGDTNVSSNQKHEGILSDSAPSTNRKPIGTSEFDNTSKNEFLQDSDSLNPANLYFTADMDKVTSKEPPNEDNTTQSTHTHKEDHNIHMGAESSSKSTSKDIKKSPAKCAQKQNDLDVNDSDDGIDSSAEIGKMKSKRLSHKAPVIKEIDEEKSGNEDSEDDVEMVDIDDTSPTVLAAKSGYLKVSRSSSSPPVIQRKVTSAVQKAAEAAERRMRKEKAAKTSGSSIELPKKDDPMKENVVVCPMCFSNFPFDDIQAHAATCDGTVPVFEQTRGTAGQQEQKSVYPSPNAQQSQEYGLKDLRVIVTRSPDAQRRLEQRESNSSFKAKRNLSLTKKGRADTEKKVKEVVDMTSDDDDDDTPKWIKNNKSQSKDDSQGTSQNVTWLTTESQEMRKKAKFKFTYGGKKKMANPKNPFSTLDYIPLQEQATSSDSEADTTKTKPQLRSSTNDTPAANGVHTTPNAPSSSKGKAPSNDCVDIDSASDSDSELLPMYGVKENTKALRNINDVLRPKKQDLTSKKKKTKPRDDFDEDDYANERALMELAGITDKSPSSDYQPSEKRPSTGHQSKASKRRRKRATISSDESDENDEYVLCFVCDKRILKETYGEHTEACLSYRHGSAVTPSKPRGNTNTPGSSTRSSRRQTARPSTSNTVEMDSDEIGDSPIKTFKLIGEEETSVDFENQFAHFGNKKTRSSSNRGSKGGRGRGRGRFKKKWRKKKN